MTQEALRVEVSAIYRQELRLTHLANDRSSRGMPAPLFSDRTARLGTENAFKIGPYIAAIEDTGRRVINCNIGEPDFPLARHIAEEVKRCLDAGMTHYVDPQG